MAGHAEGRARKSLEQRLYEALHKGRGIRLSADEVAELLDDDAVGTRITNAAGVEAGAGEQGTDAVGQADMSWAEFKRYMRGEA